MVSMRCEINEYEREMQCIESICNSRTMAPVLFQRLSFSRMGGSIVSHFPPFSFRSITVIFPAELNICVLRNSNLVIFRAGKIWEIPWVFRSINICYSNNALSRALLLRK